MLTNSARINCFVQRVVGAWNGLPQEQLSQRAMYFVQENSIIICSKGISRAIQAERSSGISFELLGQKSQTIQDGSGAG